MTRTTTESTAFTTTTTATSIATTTTAVIATTTRVITRCVLDDFYIIYETSWLGGTFRTLLDTRSNIIGKPLGLQFGEYVSTEYYMPCADLQAIHDAIIEYDIQALDSPDLLGEDGPMIRPRVDYRITFFLNGNRYSVQYHVLVAVDDPSAYPSLAAFDRMLMEYYTNTDEYKSFPKGQPLT